MLTTLALASALAPLSGARPADGPVFAPPVRLEAAGATIRTEAPGYAAPALYDLDGDGRRDLVVGQFAGGKMRVFPRLEDGTFGEGRWLQAGGDVAEVPGVW